MYSFEKYTLKFKRPGGTSRGVLHTKDTYFINYKKDEIQAVGECNLFKGLSADDVPDYENQLQKLCTQLNTGEKVEWEDWRAYPSIQFGWEQLQNSIRNNGEQVLFPSAFTQGREGIRINGLIWMGSIDFMKEQIQQKLQQGFTCLKLKIGTDWAMEKKVIRSLRKEFPLKDLEIRVDANGAFSFTQAQEVLDSLYELDIHSIEQPIKAGNILQMSELCKSTPTPIALDEELIGVFSKKEKENLLQQILPQYIILKPALVGGFKGSKEWIEIAEKNQVKWWVTSALESNVGLNALAQWTFLQQNTMPQGLGTGGLFTNNTNTRLEVRGEKLWFNPLRR